MIELPHEFLNVLFTLLIVLASVNRPRTTKPHSTGIPPMTGLLS